MPVKTPSSLSLQQTKVTASSLYKKLNQLARKNREAKQGYRDILRASMGKACRILDYIDADDALRQKFVAKLIKKKSKLPAEKINITTEVVAFLFDASNRSARQRAWKYGTVLDHDCVGGGGWCRRILGVRRYEQPIKSWPACRTLPLAISNN